MQQPVMIKAGEKQPADFLAPYMSTLYWLIAGVIVVHISGLFSTIMALDAARYAEVAKTMVVKHNYIELFSDNAEWLDKPHFPFWITAFFFNVFGIHTWVYKLPGLLFVLGGAWYTFLFARRLYNKNVAVLAVLILLTAEHIILSDNDVRAEPFLTGLIIASVYHYYRVVQKAGFLHLVLASFFAACALMTKGMMALIPIWGALGGYLFMRRDWKNLFQLKWLVSVVLITLFIMPELYSLWYQFDSHPEKIVFARTHVSGIRFFFWDSQFGRFMNSGPIKGSGDPFFFLHTLLWAFLPWSILMYIACYFQVKNNLKRPPGAEWWCISASVLSFIIFSLSRFQLPHYLNIIFPFLAIITAAYIGGLQAPKTLQRVKVLQYILSAILLLGPIAVQLLFQPQPLFLGVVLVLLAIGILFFYWLFRHQVSIQVRTIIITVLSSLFANFYLNTVFYPALLHYQSGSEAAFWINQNNPRHLPVASSVSSFPLEFYSKAPVHFTDSSGQYPLRPYLLYTDETTFTRLLASGNHVNRLKDFDEFPVTRIDMEFFNKATRAGSLKKNLVVQVNP